MILLWIVLIPFLAGLLAWVFGRLNKPHLARWTSLVANGLVLVMALCLWRQHSDQMVMMEQGLWLEEFRAAWVPQWGISFYLAMDGISLMMVLLAAFLGMVATLASWSEIEDRAGFYYFNLLWVIAGIMGVFLALDLFLFYFFWEMMLIPMYFLIGIWGHENRLYASFKFFIFTQVGGLLLLLSMLALYYIHHGQMGFYSFNYTDLLKVQMDNKTQLMIMLGFLAAFIIKLPAFPFHTWLPDAHTEAPTGGSLILAGVLLKTGAYGILRFVLPLFPQGVMEVQTVMMFLGMAGSLYGAILAFAQRDLKRLVAYSSVSHMGLVLLGLFSANNLSLQGVMIEMICHGLSTGGLFLLAGTIQEHIHTRELSRMGGFFTLAPKMGVVGLFFAMASLGLPGLGNFVGEFLILFGAYQVNPLLTILATAGLVAGTVYSLWVVQKVFHGEPTEKWHLPDLCPRRLLAFGSMMVVLFWLGLYPRPVLDTIAPALNHIQGPLSKASHVALVQASFFGGKE